MRTLASIQRVEEISPIEGADAIEKIRVLGWTLVAKKQEFAVGDLCVFFEIDALLPELPVFEFMRSSKFRLRTKKLRGVISQGLALPTAILRDFSFTDEQIAQLSSNDIGMDVTSQIGVVKYEPPQAAQPNRSETAGLFPFYVPKTDETRIQSSPALLDELKGLRCYITVKLDGTSATFIHRKYEEQEERWACSRNLAVKESDENVYWRIEHRYDILNKLAARGNFAVQGEICGPGIQKNRIGLSDIDFFAFNVYNIDTSRHLSYDEFIAFCQDMGLKTVPILDDNFIFNATQDELLAMADGEYPLSRHPREGIVIRPVIETYSRTLQGRLSCKAISNAFLLKIGE